MIFEQLKFDEGEYIKGIKDEGKAIELAKVCWLYEDFLRTQNYTFCHWFLTYVRRSQVAWATWGRPTHDVKTYRYNMQSKRFEMDLKSVPFRMIVLEAYREQLSCHEACKLMSKKSTMRSEVWDVHADESWRLRGC